MVAKLKNDETSMFMITCRGISKNIVARSWTHGQNAGMEERLEKLEIRFMATEDLLDELNRTVWRQQNEIELLREHVRLLADQLRSVQASASDIRQEDEIPPHW